MIRCFILFISGQYTNTNKESFVQNNIVLTFISNRNVHILAYFANSWFSSLRIPKELATSERMVRGNLELRVGQAGVDIEVFLVLQNNTIFYRPFKVKKIET